MARHGLVILAAGRGSRFGGAKQLAEVGPTGDVIFDYNARDAWAAGFNMIVLVTRSDLEPDITTHVRQRWPGEVDVRIVCQDTDEIAMEARRRGRRQPLGTAHAAMVGMLAADQTSVGVVNADDLYGPEPFRLLVSGLQSEPTSTGILVTFPVAKTFVGNKTVTRALCDVDGTGHLISIEEGTLEPPTMRWTGTSGRRLDLDGDERVSMNCWGFPARYASVFGAAARRVAARDESVLPDVVRGELNAGAGIRALTYGGGCIGLTHADDLEVVRTMIHDAAW